MADAHRGIENLQKALAMEMTAIHQYLLHAHVLDDWGLDVLAAKMREEMHEELAHAGRFTERILFLGGEPRIAAGKPPKPAKGLEGMFSADLAEEEGAIAFYAEAAGIADEDRDIGTRLLFEAIVVDEEGHKDWLARQLRLMKRMGEPSYMAQSMSDVARGA
jgi:bacterioferritin